MINQTVIEGILEKMGFEIEEPEEAELENGEKVFAFDIVTEQALDFDIIFDETKTMFELAKQCF